MANLQAARAAPAWSATPPEPRPVVGAASPLALAEFTHDQRPRPPLKRPEALALLALAVALHGAVFYWLARQPETVLPEVPPQIPPMTIEFAAPAPPVVETPPPEPPPPLPEPVVQAPEPPTPVVDELAAKPAPPKPKPVVRHPPKPKPQPVPKPVAKQETPPSPPPQAAAPAPQPAPPAPPPAPVKEETPASATAGYLRNPPPEYPALALRRNWEGTVLLRVRVLPNGRPSDIQIQQSAGRSQLDEAAVAAVRRWSFVPAKKGDQAIEGWVTVPIDFKIR